MRKGLGIFKKTCSYTYIALVMALLYAPILLIIIFSFSGNARFNFNQGFNFNSYRQIFTSDSWESLLKALENTFLIAIVSSVIATILGSISAIGIHSLGKKMRTVVSTVNQIPIVNSEIVIAVSLMVFFSTFAFPQGYVRLIIGHVSFCTPYVVLSVLPLLQRMDKNIYEAALDLGSSPLRALFKVLLPNLVPGILSGFVMAFTLSLDDFIITQINKGAGTGIETLSTFIYEDARVKSISPYWFAVFSIIFVVVISLLLLANLRKLKSIKSEVKSK